MSSRSFFCRLIFNAVLILLALSVIRVSLGGNPLSLSYLMNALSELDLDFSTVLYHVSLIAESFDFSGDVNFWTGLIQFLRGIFNVITLPLSILSDLFSFVSSVFRFVIVLLGMNVFEG